MNSDKQISKIAGILILVGMILLPIFILLIQKYLTQTTSDILFYKKLYWQFG